jgi:hypothetical protein
MGNSEHPDNGREAAGPDYKVGYRRPPIASRFKPGNPGNPTGRRKRRKTVGEIIREAMTRRIDVKENGRSRRLTLQEVIILKLARAAAQGDAKAIRTLFTLQERYQDSDETALNAADLEAEDRKIIEEHLAQLRSVENASESQAGPNDQANRLNMTDDGEPEGSPDSPEDKQ